MAYTFDAIFAADPSNTTNVASNAAITIYDPADATKAPVALTDVTDLPITNPVTVNKNGFGPAFKHATLDRLAWSGGGFEGFFTSYEGIKNVAVAAQEAAEAAGAAAAAEAAAGVAPVVAEAEAAAADAAAAQAAAAASATAAANSAALVGAPADSAIAAAINGSATQTKSALNAKLAPKRGNTIALFGHSIVEYNEGTTVAGPPPEHNVRSDGWFRWLNAFLRQRFTLNGIFGYPGYTVTQLKGVTAAAKDSGASYVMFHGVINSLTQGHAASAIIADLDIIVQEFLDNGQTFILCTEWPATTLTTTAHKEAHEAVNRWILAQANRPGVIVIPWHQVMTDATTGNPKANALADGTHPLTFGAMTAARAAFNILDPIIPKLGDGALISSNAGLNNAITNGMMLGTTGAKTHANTTGTVADGWQLEVASGSFAANGSKVARADGFGEWQQVQVTTGTGSGTGGVLLTRTQNLPAGWVTGDKVFAEFEFETDADFANASTIELIVWGLTSASAVTQTEWTMRNSNGSTDTKRLGSISGVIRTDPMTLLSTTAKLQFRLMLNAAAGTTATIRIGRARLGRVL